MKTAKSSRRKDCSLTHFDSFNVTKLGGASNFVICSTKKDIIDKIRILFNIRGMLEH